MVFTPVERDYLMKFFSSRPSICLTFCLICVLFSPLVTAAGASQIPQDSIYQKVYSERRFNVSPREFNFLVDNLVGVLAIASQPAFREKHMLFSGLKLDGISGQPDDFTIKVQQHQARVVMDRPAEKEILYQADIKLEKFKLSITGQLWALMKLKYDDPTAQGLNLDITVAFKPSSAILGTALKPLLGAFEKEMDRITSRLFLLADDFLKVYQAELADSFSQSALLARAAELIQKNKTLQAKLERRQMGGAGGGDEAKEGWSGGVGWVAGLAACLLGGGLLGLWLGRRGGKGAKKRTLLRLLREQEARDSRLEEALAQHRATGLTLEEHLDEASLQRAELKRRARELAEDADEA